MREHASRNVAVAGAAASYDEQMSTALLAPIYRFGEGVVEGDALQIDRTSVRIPGFEHAVSLDVENPFPDMVD